MVSRTAQPKSLSSFALRVSVSSGLYRPPTEAFAGASRVGGVNSAQAAARGDKLSLQPASKTGGSPVSSSCFHRKANRKSCTVCARETVHRCTREVFPLNSASAPAVVPPAVAEADGRTDTWCQKAPAGLTALSESVCADCAHSHEKHDEVAVAGLASASTDTVAPCTPKGCLSVMATAWTFLSFSWLCSERVDAFPIASLYPTFTLPAAAPSALPFPSKATVAPWLFSAATLTLRISFGPDNFNSDSTAPNTSFTCPAVPSIVPPIPPNVGTLRVCLRFELFLCSRVCFFRCFVNTKENAGSVFGRKLALTSTFTHYHPLAG
ncbi:hypothetical protein DIPPA_27515 [Diplonema papillatum]|nr:hypothetical protein DIPPA_27515 [Diplonema papillatum]